VISPEAHVQRELDELAEAIGHSVSVDDAGGLVLGYSVQGEDVDPVRVRAILTRRVPREVLEHQRRHGVETATGPVQVPASDELGMAARVCIPLGRGRRRLGYLWILAEGLGSAEIATARKSAQKLVRLLEARAVGAREVDALFARALRTRRPDAIARLGELIGDGAMRIAVALPAAPASIRHIAAHIQPESATLLVLASADISAAADARTVIGISPPANLTAESLGRLHATAVLAAGCASVDPVLPRVVAWTELGIYARLLRTTRPSAWSEDPLLKRSPSSAMLERTLEIYLDNAGDAARTTTALTIHRTTLYYRLGRLKSEHGIDLQDGLSRTDLHTALKLRRLALARRRYGWSDELIALAR